MRKEEGHTTKIGMSKRSGRELSAKGTIPNTAPNDKSAIFLNIEFAY